ncbi:MAG: hypothetical protein ACE5HL_11220 [Terriglobia bacterium]
MDSFVSEKDKPTTYYRIADLRSGSATIEVEAVPARKDEDYAARVVDMFVEGVVWLEEKGKAPPGFDRPLLEAFKELAKPLRRKVDRIELGRGRLKTKISKRIEVNIERIIGEDIVSSGSVSGYLDVVNVHDKNAFFIYPVVGPTKIECYFPDEILEKVKAGIKRHVVAAGTLRYKHNEVFPYRVEVQDLDVFPPEEELPTLESLRGAAPGITGTLDSVEFVRRLRDAE